LCFDDDIPAGLWGLLVGGRRISALVLLIIVRAIARLLITGGLILRIRLGWLSGRLCLS